MANKQLDQPDYPNPYAAPLATQSDNASTPRSHRDSNTWATVRDCFLLILCISLSGAAFGMGLGTIALGPEGFIGGAIGGLILAFVASIVMVCLCRTILPIVLRSQSQRFNHYAVGLTSGGLTGIVSVLFSTPAEPNAFVFLMAVVAALMGGIGGFIGSLWSSPWHRENWELA